MASSRKIKDRKPPEAKCEVICRLRRGVDMGEVQVGIGIASAVRTRRECARIDEDISFIVRAAVYELIEPAPNDDGIDPTWVNLSKYSAHNEMNALGATPACCYLDDY